MEKFSKHIAKVLARHDYVVIPGLGGFITQTESARIVASGIMPPVSTIAFNPLMQHDDGLLAIEISKAEQISYREAVDYADIKVREFKARISTETSIVFGCIGTFTRSRENALVFEPNADPGFLPGNFQLLPLSVSTREELSQQPEQKSRTITLGTSRMFKYGAAAMIVLGLFLTAPKVENGKTNEMASLSPSLFYNLSTSSLAMPDSTRASKDTATNEETPKQTDEESKTTQAIATTPTSKPQTSKPEQNGEVSGNTPQKNIQKQDGVKHYHLIVACLSTRESAQEVCDNLRKANYKSASVIASAKTFRASIKSFDSMQEALNYKEKLSKKDDNYKESWVAKN